MTNQKTKLFPLRVVLTVTTDRLLTEAKGPRDNGIGDLYGILNWMTGDNLFTHQLPRAGEACRPYLLSLFPELNKATEALSLLDQGLTRREPEDAIQHWLTQLKMLSPELKDAYEIPPMPEGWVSIDPILEAESMVGKDRVTKVNAPVAAGDL